MPFIAALFLLIVSTPALADSQTYDPTGAGYQNEAAQIAKEQEAKARGGEGVIVPREVTVDLVPFGQSGESAGLRFSVPDVVNGCWDISPLHYETSTQGPYYFDVSIKHYTRKEGKCGGGNRMARATVPLEKSLLEQGKIKILRLSIGPVTDRFEAAYENGTLTIKPQSTVKFLTDGILSYNFDRDGKGKGQLVALVVPIAPVHLDTYQAAEDFAMMYALTPAPETATSSLARTNGGSAIHYYYDGMNTLAPRLGPDFAPVGQTAIPMTYDLLDGRAQEYIPAQIYARRID